jgi:hypothetical protein
MPPTIAVDFDGVIHRYSRGWQDGSIYDPPVEGAFDALRAWRREVDVVIYTTRANHDADDEGWRSGVAAIRAWFALRGAPDLADLPITDRKPLAVAYLDDRAVRFRDWSQATRDLNALLEGGTL